MSVRPHHPPLQALGKSSSDIDLNKEEQEVPNEFPSFSSEPEDAVLELNMDMSYVEILTEAVVRMQPTRPEIVRAVPVHQVLRGLSPALRGRKGDFYSLSVPTDRMDAFWSHSWHGSSWMKIATVFFLSNATAACTISTAAAILAGIAFGLGWLPSFDSQSVQCFWCMGVGCVSYALALLYWRSRRKVFVDRICISQDDPQLKAEGLFSLGAILQSADEMLVLWDPSWARRLWCVFELAAFLYTRPSNLQKPPVSIRPTLLGHTIFSVLVALLLAGWTFHLSMIFGYSLQMGVLASLGLCGVIFFAIAHLARVYCRNVTTLCDQVATFRVATAKSYCCDVDHKVSGDDQPMICDREIVQRCIVKWFGSVQTFEQRVQSEVCNLLVDQLSNHMLSYWRLLEASPIFFWFMLDQAARELFEAVEGDPQHYYGLLSSLYGLTYWLAGVPVLFRVLFRLAWMLQAKRAYILTDWLVSLLLLLFGLVLFGAMVFLHLYSLFEFGYPFGPILWSAGLSCVALVAWNKLPVPVPRSRERSR